MIVEVYKNLNKGNISIRDYKTKKVIGYSDSVMLKNCSFHVGEKSRQRVIRTKHKNVHAYVKGELVDETKELVKKFSYDPYKYGYFYDKKTLKEIKTSELVVIGFKEYFYV